MPGVAQAPGGPRGASRSMEKVDADQRTTEPDIPYTLWGPPGRKEVILGRVWRRSSLRWRRRAALEKAACERRPHQGTRWGCLMGEGGKE